MHLRMSFTRACPKRKPAPAEAGGWGWPRGLAAAWCYRDVRRVIVGDDAVDLLVQEAVIVALNFINAMAAIQHAQCINYLRATGLLVCLRLNFGNPRLGIKRIVLGL